MSGEIPSRNRETVRHERKRSLRRQAARKLGRKAFIERLEPRRMLAVDWRNPVDSLDVTADTFIVPLDALVVINELNGLGPRALPAARDVNLPFLDVSGDNNVTSLDALLVINALNGGVSGRRVLTEGGGLANSKDVTVTVGQTAGSREFRARVEAAFDVTGESLPVNDLLAVYVVQPGDANATLLDRGTPGTSIFALRENELEFAPGIARWDGNELVVDLTSLAGRDTAVVRFQLLDGDSDRGTRVTIVPQSNQVFPNVPPSARMSLSQPLVAPSAASNLEGAAVRADVEAVIENIRFDAVTGVYAAELSLVNRGEPIGRDAIVAFPGLPAGVNLAQSQGTFGVDAAPFLDLHDAIPDGGLRRGARSRSVPLTFLAGSGAAFAMTPLVVAGLNRPPVFPTPSPLTTKPGDVLRQQLVAQDPDGDRLRYAVVAGPTNLSFELSADGTIEIRPLPGDEGSYEFRVSASDGALQVEQVIQVDVVADPVTSTRVSGRVLRVDGQPLAGMQVEVGGVLGLTANDGSFRLDLGGGSPVSDTLRVRGELFPGLVAYPFIAERLELILERELIPGIENVVARPIFLPELDTANGVTVIPTADTTVRTAALPGAEVLVRAGTLFNQQGSPFTGVMSITEVPVDRTPAVLPQGLVPDLVVTIQPGEMVFAQPAPLSLPNRAGLAPGAILDLWSINPATGDFDLVGTGTVSVDGARIDTTAGGIRNSSWHFFVLPPPSNQNQTNRLQDPTANLRNQANSLACGDCPPDRTTRGDVSEPASSEVVLHSGRLMEEHALPTYQSVGVDRGVRLVYDSLRADPRPILHFAIDDAFGSPAGSDVVDLAVARLFFEHGGVRQQVPGFEPDPASFGLALAGGEHFYRLPAGTNRIDVALQADLTNQPTGVYEFELEFGVQRFDGLTARNGRTQVFNRRETMVNLRSSPFGAGWDMAGLQEIVENPDGSVLLVSGGGDESVYDPPPTPGSPFVSPLGDFGRLEKSPDGTFRYTDQFQSVTQFGQNRKIASLTDRNGNRTTFEYDTAGVITRVVDPVGLATTFVSAQGKVTSIVDPAGRTTRLVHSGENLVEIIDADDSRRRFEYDESRRMTAEVDKRGFREEEVYGFHGRVVATKDKEGNVRFFAPVQAAGLFPVQETTNLGNPPTATIAPRNEAVATFTDANGRVVVTVMDENGLELARTDGVGALPTTVRNEAGLPVRITDARGNVTELTYDERGNVLSIVDEVARDLADELPKPILFDGPKFGLSANASLRLLSGDIDGDGDGDILAVNDVSASITILKNIGVASFAAPTVLSVSALRNALLADADGDGDLDIVALRSETGSQAGIQNVSFLFNDGTGLFASPVSFAIPGANSSLLAVGDLDGDGRLDVMTANNGATRPLVVLFGNDAGSLGSPVEIPLSGLIGGGAVRDLAVGDLTGDGRMDLAAIANAGNLVTVRGIGSRQFAPPTQQALASNLFQFSLADLDADADLDLVASGVAPGTGATHLVVALNDGVGAMLGATTIPSARLGSFLVEDVDGDAALDLVTNAFVHRGVGNGTFLPAVEYAPLGVDFRGIALLDLDRDQQLDLFLQEFGESFSAFLSRNGVFRGIPKSALSFSADDLTVGDLDGDGDQDVVAVSSSSLNNVALLFNDGTGALGNRRDLSASSGLASAALGDADGDGDRDLLVSGSQSVTLIRLSQGGLGSVQTTSLVAGNFSDAAFADIDADGDLDIIAARPSFSNANGSVTFLLNDGLGQFTAVGDAEVGAGKIQLAVGDLDNDGDSDLVTSNSGAVSVKAADIAVLLNTGAGAFADAVFNPFTIGSSIGLDDLQLVDLNRDGALDVVANNDNAGNLFVAPSSRAVIWPGRGDGTLGDLLSFVTGIGSYGVDVADFDGDGNLDILTGGSGSTGGSGPNPGASLTVLLADGGLGVERVESYQLLDSIRGAIQVADMNGDGLPDVVALADTGVQVRLHRGNLPVGPAQRFTYEDQFNQLASRSDELGRTATFQVDPLTGNVLAETIVIGAPGGGDDLTTTYTYNARGQVVTLTDPLGRVTEHAYDSLGRKVRTTEAKGTGDEAITRFEYDAAGNRIALVDALGRRTEMSFDAMNRVLHRTDALGFTTSFTFDAAGNATRVTDARGNATFLQFDELNRPIAVTDPVGGLTSMNYDPNGNPTEVVDPLGRVTRFVYDARDRVVAVVDPAGSATRNEYDGDNNLTRVIDPLGAAFQIGYDSRNRQVAVTDPLGEASQFVFDASDRLVREVDRLGGVTAYAYDAAGRQVTVVDALGGTTRTEYDKAGNITRAIDELGRATTFDYDHLDRQSRTTDPLGGITLYTYDKVGNRLSVTDPAGRVTTTAYDALNRQTSITDAVGGVIRQVYDAMGNVVEIVDALGFVATVDFDARNLRTRMTDPLGAEYSYEYNAAGELTAEVDPLGRRSTTTYDLRGNQATFTDAADNLTTFVYSPRSELLSTTDALGRRTTQEYDLLGRVVRQVDRAGFQTAFAYDAEGNLLETTDRKGNATRYEYDSLDRRIKTIDALGGETVVSYDAADQKIEQHDPLGRVTTYSYDALGRIVRVVDPAGNSTDYEFDAVGNNIRITDPLGRVTRDRFDDIDRRIERIDPLGNSYLFVYDLNRNLIRKTDERGNETSYVYDALGRETASTDARGGVWTKSYDLAGQLTTLADALNQATQFRYDAVGNLIETVDALGNGTSYEYDAVQNRIREVDALGNVTSYEYDAMDRQSRVVDRLGNITLFGHDPNGNVEVVTDRRGNETRFAFDALNRLVATTDALGNVQRNGYDAAGQLTLFENELGERTEYEYDLLGNQLSAIDHAGNETTYEYDAVSNLLRTTNSLGESVRSEYDALDRRIAFVDALGGRTTVRYDEAGNIVEEVDFLGNQTFKSYDELDRVATITDAMGGELRFVYDAVGRVVRRTDALGGSLDTVYDAVGNVLEVIDERGHGTVRAYDAVYNLVSTTDPLGFITRFEHDDLGREVKRIDARGKQTEYVYDAEGNVTSVTDPLGNQSRTEYDELNRPIRVIDALGGTVSRTLDPLGRILKIVDPLGRETQFTYNIFGQPLRITDALGGVTENSYDDVGNLLSTTDPLGRATEYEYDANHRMLRVTDPLGRSTAREYDANGNALRVVDPLGAATITTYDALNRVTRITDALGKVTARSYDALGRLLERVDARGESFQFAYDAAGNQISATNSLGQITVFEYDERNQRTETTDPLGQVTRSQYDELGRLVRTTDERGFHTSFAYDDNGNLTSITDANGNTTTYAYDSLNRKTRETNPLAATRLFNYDAVGNLTSRTDRQGRKLEFQYDALNRRVEEAWFNAGAGTAIHTITTSFDAAGQVTGLADANATYTYAYSDAGERLSVSNAGSPGVPAVTLEFAHDDRGDVVKRTEKIGVSTGAVTDYVRDALGRVTRITQAGVGIGAKRVDLGYDPVGLLVSLDRFSDLAGAAAVAKTTATYDPGGRTTSLKHEQGATIINQYSNSFDALDRLASQGSSDGTSAYSYDATSQLTSADHANQSDEVFVYDAVGNRLGGDNTVGANNRQLSDGEFNYEYDAEGNRVRRTAIVGGEVTEYSYDHRNRLTRIVTKPSSSAPASREATYSYDALNRRIAKSVDSDGVGPQPAEVTRFVLDDDQIVLTFDGTGVVTRRVLAGPVIDQVLAEETAAGVIWSLVDQLGSVRDLVDSSGVVVEHQVFSAFGELTAQSNPSVDHLFGFTGRELDDESGLMYFRNRYYDPHAGRFISEDPSGFDGEDVNLNRYVGNNPTNQTDPLGLAPLNVVEIANDPKRLVEFAGLVRQRLDFADAAAAAGMMNDDVQAILRGVDKSLSENNLSDAASQLFSVTMLAGIVSANRAEAERGPSVLQSPLMQRPGRAEGARLDSVVAPLAGGLGLLGPGLGQLFVAQGEGGGDSGGRLPVPGQAPVGNSGVFDLDEDDVKKAAAAAANAKGLEKAQLLAEIEGSRKDAAEAQRLLEGKRKSLENANLRIFQNARKREELLEQLDKELNDDSQVGYFGQGAFLDLPLIRGLRDLFTKGITLESAEERNARVRREMKSTFSDVSTDLGDLVIPGFTTGRKLLYPSKCDPLTVEDVLFDSFAFLEVFRAGRRIKEGARNPTRQIEEVDGVKHFNGKPLSRKAAKLLEELDEFERIQRGELRTQRELGDMLDELTRREFEAQQRLQKSLEEGRKKFNGDKEVEKLIEEVENSDDALKKARREFLGQEKATRDKRAAIDEKVQEKFRQKGFEDFQDFQRDRFEKKQAELDRAKKEFSEQLGREFEEFQRKQRESLPNIEDELSKAAKEGDDIKGQVDKSLQNIFVTENLKALNRVVGPLVDNFNAKPRDVAKAIKQVADERFGGDIVKAAIEDPDGIALRFFRNQAD